jgi:sugar-specific transcriptional regulator TrmB
MKELESVGLSYYESRAVDALLKGGMTAKQLSRIAKIPAGKVYHVVKTLKQKGIIQETDSRPKNIFIPYPGKTIASLIEQKTRSDEDTYRRLRMHISEACSQKTASAPFFQLGTTLEDNTELQMRSFNEAKKEVCQILNIHHRPGSNRTSKSLWEKEIKAAVERGVVFRCIYPTDSALPDLLTSIPKNSFLVRKLDTDFIRCDIIDRRKVLLKLVQSDPINFGGIIFLEDERFAKNLQKVFEQFWLEAKE